MAVEPGPTWRADRHRSKQRDCQRRNFLETIGQNGGASS